MQLEKIIGLGLLTAGVWGVLPHLAVAEPSRDQLQREFLAPPESAKPWVWWHWMNGNVTEEGIKLDLEWMHRVGVGGLQTFDASLGTSKVVEHGLVYMTPPWNEAFRYAVTLADQLGLEFAIAGHPGMSESGGPWVPASQSMKKLVWSETRVNGGAPFTGKLPQPPDVVGPFQNVPVDWTNPILGGPPVERVPNLYQDVAVIAYRLPAKDDSLGDLKPVVTSSAGAIDADLLWDGDYTKAVCLPFGVRGEPAWIQLDFGHPKIAQSLSLALQGRGDVRLFVDPSLVVAELQRSDDGSKFQTVATVYDTLGIQQTVTFPPATARYFRLALPTPTESSKAVALGIPVLTGHRIVEFNLNATPRVDHFEQKAGFFLDNGLDSHPARHVAPGDVTSPQDVLDLSAYLRADGSLEWNPPAGRWDVLRFGYSLLGTTNFSASPEATGLEVDKLSRVAVKSHMDSYLHRLESIVGPDLIGQRGLHAMVNDSWDRDAQNWTEKLPEEFARRRGYDLRLWLPALTGHIIGSAEATDQFLWDFRRTLGELVAENHYGQIAASLHERRMLHYNESHEVGRAFIGDGMDAKRYDDVPMGAMWIGDFFPQDQYDSDLRESASVAHIYGQNLVGAESMTAIGLPGTPYAYAFAPEDLKSTVDREFADGVNRIIPLSVHQPLNKPGPGVTLGPSGLWFTRNETWAEQAAPWVTYLARSSYLLQQGHFVADVIYYYGQDSNITALYGKELPPIPEGYAFDFVNADALRKLTVEGGRLVTASGMSYRLLALDSRTRLMSLDVLRQIAQLVSDGATVVGAKPEATPSLADNATAFHSLVDALWGSGTTGQHRFGKGRVISGEPLAAVMTELKLEPDFSYSKPAENAVVWFVHRCLSDGDMYFVNNRQDRAARIEANFRISGKAPELWYPDTGRMEPASYRMEGDRTLVPLNLAPNDAVFVVFLKDTQQREREVPDPVRQNLATVAGPWEIHFQSERGAPEETTFNELRSWTTYSDPGIKYFSGTADYETSLNVPASWVDNGQHVEIDLGVVKNVAEVIVNGKNAGIVWKAPFRIDVTRLLRPGVNRLNLRVTNLWPNRLIGDNQPGAKKIAFATFDPYKADSPLLPSGLLGPVTFARVSVH